MRANIRLKKTLSQHFLRDIGLAEKIVASMDIREGDEILEIGPGDGVLTEWLMKKPAKRITVVELDKRLTPFLTVRFGRDERFHLIENDILKIEMSELASAAGRLRVVGNLPYSITSPILFKILENRSMVSDFTATIQKEVAERVVGSPGNKSYGIPSVFFQLHSTTEILFPVPRTAFFPVPKVDSAVLKIRFLPGPLYPIRNPGFFHEMVRSVFGQRRKMLRNTLKQFVQDDAVLDGSPIDPSRRPETLSVEEFVQLSNFLSNGI